MIRIDDIVIRLADTRDTAALERLAALDSQRLPDDDFLLAEVAGELRAALVLSSGMAIADPFYPSAALVTLLEAHPARAERSERLHRSVHLRHALPHAAFARTH